MPILQTIWNFFTKREAPKVKWMTLWFGLSISYETSFQTFFDHYKYNPYIRAVINRRKRDTYRFGIEIKKGETLQDISLFSDLLQGSIPYTPKKFIERIIRDYEVTGNAYVYVARDKKNKVLGLQALDPRYIKPVVNTKGQLLWYIQNLDGVRWFLPDEIFHLKDDNDLDNEIIGASKMESLFIDLETDKEAKESNLAFFKNNQTPASIILIDKDAEIDEDEDGPDLRFQLKELFESGKYTGGNNRHRSAFLQGVKEIVKIQDKISDAEFLELRKFTLQLVCSVYTVNADILWFTENSNRSTGDIQVEVYYDSIEEEEKTLDEFFTKILRSVYKDDSITFNAVKDSLRTLNQKSAIAVETYQGGLITLEEGREIIWYDPKVKKGETMYEQPATVSVTPKEKQKK